MLQSALRHKAEQNRLAVVGDSLAGQAWTRRDIDTLARAVAVLQVRAARDAAAAAAAQLTEQRIDAKPAASLSPHALAGASDGRTLQGLLEQAESEVAIRLMALTQIADAGRAAMGVSIAIRPAVTGYVREVGGACCSRCAILAGRFYRWSEGFQRHPGCQCVNVPTSNAGLAQSPARLLREGRVTDLSKTDARAVADGADLSSVVNAHRTGLDVAGHSRAGRLTPESIYRLASDRADAIRLLRRFGYVT